MTTAPVIAADPWQTFGPDVLATKQTPQVSRNERLWGHPGLTPDGAAAPKASPLMAYRWEHTDGALSAQFELEDEGYAGVVKPGHAVLAVSGAELISSDRSRY